MSAPAHPSAAEIQVGDRFAQLDYAGRDVRTGRVVYANAGWADVDWDAAAPSRRNSFLRREVLADSHRYRYLGRAEKETVK